MSISRRALPLGCFAIFLAGLAAALNCAPPGECLRFSDCAQGLTCAAGQCVVPPADAGSDAGSDASDAGDAADAATAADAPASQDAPGAEEAGDACGTCTEAGGGDSSSPSSDATAD